MCDMHTQIDMGFTQEQFFPGTHMCMVFRDEAERRRIVGRYVESGLLAEEHVGYFADAADPSDVETWLQDMDIDTVALGLHSTSETYYPNGIFDPDRMCDTLRTTWTRAQEDGFPNCRVTGEMSWALRNVPGTERLMEYEAAVNTVVKTHPVTAMCQYDANRFSGETIFHALRVHPYMVMNDQLVKNPYYVIEE